MLDDNSSAAGRAVDTETSPHTAFPEAPGAEGRQASPAPPEGRDASRNGNGRAGAPRSSHPPAAADAVRPVLSAPLDSVAIGRQTQEATAAFAAPSSPAWYLRVAKPLLDRSVALVLLVALSPLLLAGMLAVRLTLGPGIFFVQQRVGLGGRIFSTYKLRTMGHDRRSTTAADLQAFADGRWDGFERRRTHKSEHDPRLNRVGRWLRIFSIDEIPQLWNILRGDMSLVGPRPELPGVVAKHYQPWMHRRHVVKPGLTGLWQVSERGNGMMHEHVDVDLDYVDSIGPWTDLKILLITPYAVLARRGY